MEFVVDRTSTVPASDQLVQQVKAAVVARSALAGDRLPTVRALASELGLAPNTVAKAYRELEASGTIETRGRLGSFVSGAGVEAAAKAAAREFVGRMHALGLGEEDALELVRRAW